MARMAAGDGAELQRMYSEKVLAAGEAWNAMAVQTVLENQKLALSFMQSVWMPWLKQSPASQQLGDAALRVLGEGMAPVHRRAMANAKRLGRPRRR